MSTFTKIETITVGSGGASTLTFSTIPATYTDLVVFLSLRGAASSTERNIFYTFNANTSNRYSRVLEGTGSSVDNIAFATMYAGTYPAANATSNTFSNTFIYIPNYAGSNYKSSSVDSVMENNGNPSYMEICANLWSDTSAITSIEIPSEGASGFVQYSSATLYGIKKN